MAYGDFGGPVTELIITCKTASSGEVDIKGGDAVKLVGAYEIDNALEDGDRIFGQALADCWRNDAAVPVRVRGICDFAFTGEAPEVDGESGVVGAVGAGVVQAGAGVGLIVKVNNEAGTLEALL
ncbi:MAG TPA: hypothetical protein ENN29_03360 [Candidatus Hydrogenedentes bacterium]|nr:hypothetical protein [Candidatus Hydrogenedentota bacterium]